MDNMKTAQEILKEREAAKKIAESKKGIVAKKSTAEMVKAWIAAGMARMNEFEGSDVKYITISSSEVYDGGFTCSDYDHYAGCEECRAIAKPFHDAGYQVYISFPWDDWSGGHPGYMYIALPDVLEQFVRF